MRFARVCVVPTLLSFGAPPRDASRSLRCRCNLLKLHVARHGKRRFIFYRRTHRPDDSFASVITPHSCLPLRSPRDRANTAVFLARLNCSFFFLFDKNSATLETDNISRACWLKRANIVFSAEIYCCFVDVSSVS